MTNDKHRSKSLADEINERKASAIDFVPGEEFDERADDLAGFVGEQDKTVKELRAMARELRVSHGLPAKRPTKK